jgi:dehydrogenase/reductase SDR family protein 1
MNRPLAGKVALVTGATRGIGKGVALQLGQAGCTVYITGRTEKPTGDNKGSLLETADEIKRRGGRCIPVRVDHENDEDIMKLFQQIATEQNQRLDILVNCAFKAGNSVLSDSGQQNFWEMKPEMWDEINNVGLRNNYICCVYAARLMVPAKQGLIINISSLGGIQYMFNVPYGVGKSAVDRLSKDAGMELAGSNVTCMSLYPGVVKTELLMDAMNKHKDPKVRGSCGCNSTMMNMMPGKIGTTKITDFMVKTAGESIEFTGKVVAALAQDPKMMTYNSQCVLVADYANNHCIRDIDNRQIASVRQLAFFTQMMLPERMQFINRFIPGFIKIPSFVIDMMNMKLR